jgi:hypothetical protein
VTWPLTLQRWKIAHGHVAVADHVHEHVNVNV